MDRDPQVEAYANADFSEPNERFCALFRQYVTGFDGGCLVDLGCGPADIPVRLLRADRRWQAYAVDGSAPMLERARRLAAEHGVEERIDWCCWRIGGAPVPRRLCGAGQAVISNSLLHHLADPQALWRAVRACAAPGAAVLVMDLRRPTSRRAAQRLVDEYASQEPAVLRQDFFNSLLAAYREEEVRAQLGQASLAYLTVERVSDRHLAVYGRLP